MVTRVWEAFLVDPLSQSVDERVVVGRVGLANRCARRWEGGGAVRGEFLGLAAFSTQTMKPTNALSSGEWDSTYLS